MDAACAESHSWARLIRFVILLGLCGFGHKVMNADSLTSVFIVLTRVGCICGDISRIVNFQELKIRIVAL